MPRKKKPPSDVYSRTAVYDRLVTQKADLEEANLRLKKEIQLLTESYGRAQAETTAQSSEAKRKLHQARRFLRSLRDLLNAFLDEGAGSALPGWALYAGLGGMMTYFLSKLGS